MCTLDIQQNPYGKEIKYILKIFLKKAYVPRAVFLSKTLDSQVEKIDPVLS